MKGIGDNIEITIGFAFVLLRQARCFDSTQKDLVGFKYETVLL